MVMSQAAIDALMSQNGDTVDDGVDDELDALTQDTQLDALTNTALQKPQPKRHPLLNQTMTIR